MTLPEKDVLLLLSGVGETLYMTLAATAFAYLLGLPLGVLLVLTDPKGLRPMHMINRPLNAVVNIIRSVPFLILLVVLMPLTRLIIGKAIGTTATIVPLVISAFPFIARLVEGSLNEVDKGIIEAMQSMGASDGQIAMRAMLPEAMPSLITNATTATTTILGYSAMAGAVGGGGLGKIAIDYGYHRNEPLLMACAVIALIMLVQIIQTIGNYIAARVDKRK